MASVSSALVPPVIDPAQWKLPDRGIIGIACLIITESALFSIFVVGYIFYIGKSLNGPYPKDVLHFPVLGTIALLSSSVTIVIAERALEHGRRTLFQLWWIVTILLGAFFLGSTAMEWHQLIVNEHLTISTNLFGTTFYSLVGLHASHVIVGLLFLLLVGAVTLFGFPIETQKRRVMFLSWYWHFVDVVWIIVFTVVYIVGR
jgi:cytochrome c oxidase subunit 3/cytochrome o ubiquinol oxidase subunit 3